MQLTASQQDLDSRKQGAKSQLELSRGALDTARTESASSTQRASKSAEELNALETERSVSLLSRINTA